MRRAPSPQSGTHRGGPPAFAAWLFERLVSSPNRDALAGDLIEQYAAGRSRAWYWRQTIGAIVMDAANQTRAHRLSALRGVALGWTVLIVLWLCAGPVLFGAAQHLKLQMMEWVFFEAEWGTLLGNSFVHTQVAALPMSAAAWIMAAVAGWCAGRLHRRQQVAIVLLFALSVALFQAWRLGLILHNIPANAWPRSPMNWRIFRGFVAAGLVRDAVGIACIVIAGMWGAGRSKTTPPSAQSSDMTNQAAS